MPGRQILPLKVTEEITSVLKSSLPLLRFINPLQQKSQYDGVSQPDFTEGSTLNNDIVRETGFNHRVAYW